MGVEIVEEAVETAKENAALNGLENCEFLAGDVLKVLDDITENRILLYWTLRAMASIQRHWRKLSAMA